MVESEAKINLEIKDNTKIEMIPKLFTDLASGCMNKKDE